MKTLRFSIEDSSYAGEIRRNAVQLAGTLGFGEAMQSDLAIVTNELCSNICKHAGHGEVLLTAVDGALHILALDKGRGMRNVTQCLEDGFSTTGTRGTGLGAIRRLARRFDIYSQEGRGTVLYAAFGGVAQPPFELGAVAVPYPGEEVSGDAWARVQKAPGLHKIAMADGLGHGLLASKAADTVVKVFPGLQRQTPVQDIQSLHEVLRATRGAAVSVAEIDFNHHRINYAGLGNVSGSIVAPTGSKRMISYNGTAGVQLRKVQPMSYPFGTDNLLVMYTDGLVSHWDIADYPGLFLRHPFLVAGLLYRDFTRNTDDVTVLVARLNTHETSSAQL